jgi:RimJ/RimL family protein N-acetyltransferase
MIETPRLRLRRWHAEDLAPYAAIMADRRVTDWLAGPLTSAETAERIARQEASFEQNGFGRFAVERRADGALLGHCGLMPAHPEIPLAPAVEAGWALAPDAWGHGYAVEAARAVLADGFARLGLAEIVAYTTRANLRSQAVMARAGFTRDAARDFDHPALARDHPLRPHLTYAARRPRPQ